MNKNQLLEELYEVYQSTENEEVFKIIGKVIDFVKTEIRWLHAGLHQALQKNNVFPYMARSLLLKTMDVLLDESIP